MPNAVKGGTSYRDKPISGKSAFAKNVSIHDDELYI
jgi:hypothetical protein